MRGYVQNEGTQAYFVCQRQIPPGGKVKLDDVYKSVGRKSGLEEGLPFIDWVKSNVFTRGTWGYYEEENKLFGETSKPKKAAPKKAVPKKQAKTKSAGTSSKKEKDAKGAGRSMRRDTRDTPGTHDVTGGNVTPSAIIEAPYDQARALIEKTKDRVVLKKALNLTKHFSGKEQHMRHIVKRLEQVY